MKFTARTVLKTRIVTSAILLAMFLPVTFLAPVRIFGALIVLMLALAAWEWARLFKLNSVLSIVYALIVGAGLTQSTYLNYSLNYSHLYSAVAVFWLCIVPFLLIRQPTLTVGVWRGLLLVAGIMLFLACWSALIAARSIGISFMLSLLSIVWSADTGAYFVGRRLGSYKLAPSISPAKTWEGVIGGWLFTLLVATPISYATLASISWLGRLIVITSLVALSIVGDLFVSLIKRQAGVKDSSALLPGHGGILDRIDGMIAVLPLAMLLLAAYL